MAEVTFKVSRRVVGLSIATLVVICLAGGALLSRHPAHAASSIIPAQYAHQVTFPLYQPEGLPSSFSLDTGSFTANQNVLSYTYKYAAKQPIVVNIQALPPGFDVTTFNPTKQFSVNIGQAYMADVQTRVTTAIVNDKSLILVNAPIGIADDIMEQFVSSLQPVH